MLIFHEKNELCKHKLWVKLFRIGKLNYRKQGIKQEKSLQRRKMYSKHIPPAHTYMKKRKLFVMVPFNKMKINVALNFPAGC